MKRIKPSLKDIIYIVIIALLVGGLVTTCVLLFQKKKTQEFGAYYDQKVSAFKVENANYSKGQIVFIGDSITDLYHLDEHYVDLPLATYNRGIGGDVTSGVLNRLEPSLYDLAPSKVVLMIGINDINGRVEKKTIVSNYRKILNSVKSHLPDATLFAMSILPLEEGFDSPSALQTSTEMIIAVNTEIKNMAVKHGYTYCDLFSLVKDENNHLQKQYSLDGIHLSEAGFVTWTNMMKPLLG